jgi:hypothetical protein
MLLNSSLSNIRELRTWSASCSIRRDLVTEHLPISGRVSHSNPSAVRTENACLRRSRRDRLDRRRRGDRADPLGVAPVRLNQSQTAEPLQMKRDKLRYRQIYNIVSERKGPAGPAATTTTTRHGRTRPSRHRAARPSRSSTLEGADLLDDIQRKVS